ncbi:hypothetical protein MRQ86_36220 [Streptomyces sp. MMS21 TC-5]|uniref:hypothetical protein n=1 Tax=Streptomyces sp. MMS21 TC-5 TaxID=2925833 RepID=UPI001F607870|nr:hypothetical protein [Streptomyces sp. MMS21 TC-5]MCI4085649.1 hypothetical protein [Streptomyces sp. MMS21 TC-5]
MSTSSLESDQLEGKSDKFTQTQVYHAPLTTPSACSFAVLYWAPPSSTTWPIVREQDHAGSAASGLSHSRDGRLDVFEAVECLANGREAQVLVDTNKNDPHRQLRLSFLG